MCDFLSVRCINTHSNAAEALRRLTFKKAHNSSGY